MKVLFIVLIVLSLAEKAPGQTCATNADCGANAECTGTPLNCACKTGFFNKTGEGCVKTKNVGETCGAADECIVNADCIDTQCTCMENYTPKADNTSCLHKVGTNCTSSGDCVTPSTCVGICTCPRNYLSDNANTTCKLETGQPCRNDAQCISKAECKGKPQICLCKDGYDISDDEGCETASSGVMVMSSLMLMLAALLIPRWM